MTAAPSEQPILSPRVALEWLRTRYDHGAVAPGVWKIICELERHEAWRAHVRDMRLLKAAG